MMNQVRLLLMYIPIQSLTFKLPHASGMTLSSHRLLHFSASAAITHTSNVNLSDPEKELLM